ncbi:MAG: glycosyltransferase family 9 protein [Pseudomonadota bacterium]
MTGVNDLPPEYLHDRKIRLFYEFRPDRHILDGYLESAGLPPRQLTPALWLTPDEEARGGRILAELNLGPGPVIGLHPGATWPERTWDWYNWDRLARELAVEKGANILVLGKTPDFAPSPWPNLHNLIDRLSLRDLAAVINRLDVFVGLDSGLMHLAAARRKPVVALFGCIRPEWRKPFDGLFEPVTADVPCLGCQARRPIPSYTGKCEDGSLRCMKEIKVADVRAAVLRVLDAAGRSRPGPGRRREPASPVAGKGKNWGIFPSAAGFPTLRVNKEGRLVTLHSSRDPREEARAWAADIPRDKDVLVLGLGLGYHVQALLEHPGRTGRVVVVEAAPDLFQAALAGKVLDDHWDDPRLFLIVGQAPGLAVMRIKTLAPGGDVQAFPLRPALRLAPSYYGAIADRFLKKENPDEK